MGVVRMYVCLFSTLSAVYVVGDGNLGVGMSGILCG